MSQRDAHGGEFRFDQLAAAFDRVIQGRDWQAPIRAIIAAEDRQLVETAVLQFTATKPAFAAGPGEDALTVTAAGYRRGLRTEHFWK
jgi:hypothetical protein